MLTKEIAIEHFGDCKYSCQQTPDPSQFHSIILGDYHIYVEEWEDGEVMASINTIGIKNGIGFEGYGLIDTIHLIKNYIMKSKEGRYNGITGNRESRFEGWFIKGLAIF